MRRFSFFPPAREADAARELRRRRRLVRSRRAQLLQKPAGRLLSRNRTNLSSLDLLSEELLLNYLEAIIELELESHLQVAFIGNWHRFVSNSVGAPAQLSRAVCSGDDVKYCSQLDTLATCSISSAKCVGRKCAKTILGERKQSDPRLTLPPT